MNKPIYGHVPGALPPPPALPNGVRLEEEVPMEEELGRDWAKGLPRGTKKADVIAGVVTPPSEPPKRKPGRPPAKPAAPPPGACIGCAKALPPLSLEMMGELLRVARDRLAHTDTDGRTDLLYLAARVEGCCSVACWTANVAPESLVQALFDR